MYDNVQENKYLIIQNIKCYNIPLFCHFQNEIHVKNLILLYQLSQTECSRGSNLTPEIGSSRERDLIASLKSNLLLDVNYDIPNRKKEDVIINNDNISIKHSSNKMNSRSGIKIIWTVDNERRKQFVDNFIFKCNLLIIYVRFNESLSSGELEIIYISQSELVHQQINSGIRKESIFNCLQGNSRGIEFSKIFFEKIKKKSLFHIKIKFKNFICEMSNPITKRLQILKICQ